MEQNISKHGSVPNESSEHEELYQNHGDHIDAVMDAEKFLREHLVDIVQEGVLHRKSEMDIQLGDVTIEKSTVVSILYGDSDLKFLAIVASNPKEGRNLFVAAFPYMKGVVHEVVIDKVLEWGNRMEATIKFSIGDHPFACFAQDYSYNKDKYVVGNKVRLSLAAIGMKAQEAMRGFDFEGQKAIDFLAKTGETPDYDENGNVVPIHFSTERLVAYLAHDNKAPDEAQFQSPVSNVSELSLFDIPFIKCNIMINSEADPIVVPLYFRKEFFPSVKQDDPVSGFLWLTGEIVDEM